MWPGLVGKGGPGAEPPIDLDTMLDLTAKAEVERREVRRRRPVPLRSARQHRLDRRRPEEAGRQDRPRADLVVGSVVAPVWPPTGGGSAMGSDEERKAFVTQVRKACRIAQEADASSACGQYGVVRIDSAGEPGRVGQGSRGQHQEDRRDLPRSRRRRRGLRRAARRRGRDLLGRHAQREAQGRAARAGRPAADRRLPGRHGAHAALHAGLQRAGGPHPARELRLVGPDDARRRRCAR